MSKKIIYRKKEDYSIPNVFTRKFEQSNYNIGKYGRLRLNYLKEHNYFLYMELLIDGKLGKHLELINKDAKEYLDDTIKKLAKAEGIDEKLKKTNQIEWTKAMNNIKNRAEEIVISELICW